MVQVTRLAHVGLHTVEYTAEVEQITDPNRQPRVMELYADVWKSAR